MLSSIWKCQVPAGLWTEFQAGRLRLTWSWRRAFWAPSGFLYSTNPKPMESKVPVRRERGLVKKEVMIQDIKTNQEQALIAKFGGTKA